MKLIAPPFKIQEHLATDMHDTRKDLQPKVGLTILAASLGFVLVQLDVSIVNIALAKIGVDLGTPVAGLQWVVDAYALAFAALLLSAGALGDQIGARKGFTVGFATFIVASLGCGLAPGPIADCCASCPRDWCRTPCPMLFSAIEPSRCRGCPIASHSR